MVRALTNRWDAHWRGLTVAADSTWVHGSGLDLIRSDQAVFQVGNS
jgi:hypothetical protein